MTINPLWVPKRPAMDKVGIDVALIGRNSRCKTAFLKAASISDLANDALEANVWWTSSFTPSRTDLVQAPEHGFSPSGHRLLPARLRHTSAADVVQTDKEYHEPLLLLMSADAIFHKGKLKSGGADGPSCVHAVVSRMKERLGHKPFAVALSVDIDEIGDKTVASAVKTILASVKQDLAIGGVPVVAVSPKTELWLREQVGEGGRVSYTRGDTYFRVSSFQLYKLETRGTHSPNRMCLERPSSCWILFYLDIIKQPYICLLG